MEWLVYENSDEATQTFIGVIIIISIILVIVANIYYWIINKFKKR